MKCLAKVCVLVSSGKKEISPLLPLPLEKSTIDPLEKILLAPMPSALTSLLLEILAQVQSVAY